MAGQKFDQSIDLLFGVVKVRRSAKTPGADDDFDFVLRAELFRDGGVIVHG